MLDIFVITHSISELLTLETFIAPESGKLISKIYILNICDVVFGKLRQVGKQVFEKQTKLLLGQKLKKSWEVSHHQMMILSLF